MKPGNLIMDYPAQSLTCCASKFKTYTVEQIDGHLYTIGAGRIGDEKETFKMDKMSSTTMLVSLLVLYEQLTPNLYGHVEERITNLDESYIMNWCIANGTPLETGGSDGSIADADSIWSKYGKVGFRIDSFYNQLHDLYQCYMLWRRLSCDDTTKENPYTDTPLETCKESLYVRMLTMNVRLRPNFECYPPTFYLECADYMAVAKAHMFFLCVSADAPYVGVCEVCGKPFAKMRRNNTQCETCQRNKSQRSRKNKRIAEIAQKSAKERTD